MLQQSRTEPCGERPLSGPESRRKKRHREQPEHADDIESSVRFRGIGFRPSTGIGIRSGYFPRNFKKSRHNGHFVSAHVCERHFHYWKRRLAFAEDNSG